MHILNPKLQRDIASGTPLRLDLGCGQCPRVGFYSLDQLGIEGVDAVCDLNEPLHLIPDDSVEYIYSRHAFEHITELLALRGCLQIAFPAARQNSIMSASLIGTWHARN